MMYWYKIMASISGVLILIAVVITAYKIIIGGHSVEHRKEAKDSLMRLFFGAVSIVFAPLFLKFLLLLNNNLVKMLVGYSDCNLEALLGNGILTKVHTGNAIATAIVIALFAYLFFKLNVKFIIRQFTILVFTLFTPIISIMWMINKRTVGAAIWFGQILINVFMQFIYAFLFLIYMKFLPESGGWAVSILWAMMILPIADTLQNCLQNLVSRIAGINNDELANRGIGMAGVMAHSIRTIAYQFKSENSTNNNNPSFINRFLNSNEINSPITKMKTTPMQLNKMKTNSINTSKDNEVKPQDNINQRTSSNIGKKVYNTGKEFINIGRYVADGKSFNNSNNSDFKENREIINKQNENAITNMEGKDKE